MKDQILELIKANPQLGQAVMAMVQRMSQSRALTPDTLQKLIRIFEAVLQKPELYPELRKTFAQAGMDASWLPEQFSESAIVTLLGAMYVMLDQREQVPEQAQELSPMQPQGGAPAAFARGGLASLGRGGDSQLAHVNPFEAGVLRSMGGSGGINPRTGLREYDLLGDLGNAISDIGKSVGPILSVVAPMALDYFAPGMGASMGAWAPAVMGGLGSALGGGNVLQGAAAGALGRGLGGTVGNWAGDAMGFNLAKGSADALGSALMGGALGSATGRGFGRGAVSGALGSVMGNTISDLGNSDTAWGQGIQQAGQSMGNLLSTGSSSREALTGGALAGLARGLTSRPSDVATQDYASGPTNSTKIDAATVGAPTTAPSGLSWGKAISAAPMLLTLLGGAETPEQVQKASVGMSPQQQEYFNRASQQWDWDKIKTDAVGSGMGLGQYMARNWDKLTAGNAYVKPAVKMAQGGLSMLAAGGGSGRDDTIDARLSDGEYVMDAETVALLGDGSAQEGARRLDEMRQRLRQHKGKILAQGKISPNAKSPLSYLKEAA